MRKTFTLTLITFILLVSGCTNTEVASTAPPQPTATFTLDVATQTSLPSKVLLVTLEDGWNTALIRDTVLELTGGSGWLLEEIDTYTLEDLTSEIAAAVFLGNPDDLTALVQYQGIPFIIFSREEIQPSDNMSVLIARPVDLAFVAGYIAEITAEDWRGGALIGSDGVYSENEQRAFRNGGWYLCGLCNPKFAPYPGFPTVEQQSTSADWTTWQVSADALLANRVKVAYLAPEASSAEVSGYLARMGVKLLGQGAPPPEAQENWITSLNWDTQQAFKDAWQRLVSGESGQAVRLAVMMEYTNEDMLPAGRQRLVDEVISLLQNGMIDPLPVP